MRIVYSNTIDDLVRVQLRFIERSGLLQRKLLIFRWCIPLVLLVSLLVLWLRTGSPAFLVSGPLVAVLIFLLYPGMLRRSLENTSRKLYSDSKVQAATGQFELEVTPDALIETSPGGQMRSNWEIVDGLEVTKDYAFIFLKTGLAYVVPRASILEGSLDNLVEAVRQRID